MFIYNKKSAMPSILLLICGLLLPMVGFTQSATPGVTWKKFTRSEKINPTQRSLYLQQTCLVELNDPVNLQDCKKNKIQVQRILDDRHLIIYIEKNITANQVLRFKNIWLANHDWKLSPNLLAREKRKESTNKTFLIKLQQADCLNTSLPAFRGISFQPLSPRLISAKGPAQLLIDNLLPLPCVRSISAEALKAIPESRVFDMNLNANKINLLKRSYPQANGLGEVISIKENFYNLDDLDLLNKHINSSIAAKAVSNHTTDMATIIAGAGNSSYNGRGIAPNAQITSSSFNNIFPDAITDFQLLNVNTQNHSYGTSIENFYGNLAQAYDQNVFDQRTLLHVFSAGNEGFQPAPEGSGTYTDINGYANLTGNFKMAKNVLTVGCVDTVGNLIYFSSRGPAHDGRVKPEMVAYSTEGTSNATALVSGVASLLQQAYANHTNGLYPPAALVKAILLNAAQDVDVPGLDFRTGYGNLDAYRSYKNLNEALYFTDNIEQDEEVTFTLTVPSNAQDLKVTLVWTDAPALENANRALVNDLDLKVVAPDGSTTLPWILDAAPDSTSLAKAASRGEDHLNNVEQVTLANLPPGAYKVIVSGTDISSNALDFAIAYQWDQKDEFQWTFPTQNDNMPFDGETTSYFRWESTLTTSTGSLEYSLDNGNSWIMIEAAVDLQRGYHRWLLPEGLNGVAMARICAGTDCYPTETFTLSTLPNLTVGFECGDSLLLSWENYEQATSYNIYALNDASLDSVKNVTENFFIFQKSDFVQPYFAVQPVFAGNKQGIRSVTIDYNLLSSGCYINSFYLENQGQAGLNVLLDLGTAYGISEIIIQRSNATGFVDLGTITDPSPLFLDFLDPNPAQGFNQYRAKLILDNGGIIYSELADAYFLSSLAYLVFPNPASIEEGFNVFSKDFSTEIMDFELFSSDGKLLLQKTLATDREFISTTGLAPGVYLYRISTSSRIEINKIILR